MQRRNTTSLENVFFEAIKKTAIVVGPDNLGRVCHLLKCQPGDLVEYVEDGDGDGDGDGIK